MEIYTRTFKFILDYLTVNRNFSHISTKVLLVYIVSLTFEAFPPQNLLLGRQCNCPHFKGNHLYLSNTWETTEKSFLGQLSLQHLSTNTVPIDYGRLLYVFLGSPQMVLFKAARMKPAQKKESWTILHQVLLGSSKAFGDRITKLTTQILSGLFG